MSGTFRVSKDDLLSHLSHFPSPEEPDLRELPCSDGAAKLPTDRPEWNVIGSRDAIRLLPIYCLRWHAVNSFHDVQAKAFIEIGTVE